jgi:hypothetical protein
MRRQIRPETEQDDCMDLGTPLRGVYAPEGMQVVRPQGWGIRAESGTEAESNAWTPTGMWAVE